MAKPLRTIAPLALAISTVISVVTAMPLSASDTEAILYDFTSGTNGWTGVNVSGFGSTADGLVFTTAGTDPQIVGPAMDLAGFSTTRVVIRMASDADNNQADLFYGTSFTAENRRRFTVVTDGVLREYSVPIPELVPGARLRLDPTEGTGTITVESIAVFAGEVLRELRLDNGVIELGMDLTISGGAITYLGESGIPKNYINNFDRGRQIQQSYYAGQDLDRTAEGQNPAWSPWPWNPIQVGDSFDNPAEVVEARIEGGIAYVKTIPMLWDMNNEPAECTFETWVELHDNVARVRNRLEIFRTDDIWTNVVVRDQELPAVYTITELNNLVSYLGEAPWTGAPHVEITRIIKPGAPGFPWNDWPSAEYPGSAIERWAATVNDSGWGVGVFYKGTERLLGGSVGQPGQGEFSSSTMYISPLRRMAFGKTETFEYEYDVVVGTLEEIRDHVYGRMGPEVWSFETDGDPEGWSLVQHGMSPSVSGGSFTFDVTDVDPIVQSGEVAIAAPLNGYLHLRMRNGTSSTLAQLFWANEFGGPGTPGHVVNLPVPPSDDGFRDLFVDLSAEPGWKGTITALRLDPANNVTSGTIEIDGIAITDSPVSPFAQNASVTAWQGLGE